MLMTNPHYNKLLQIFLDVDQEGSLINAIEKATLAGVNKKATSKDVIDEMNWIRLLSFTKWFGGLESGGVRWSPVESSGVRWSPVESGGGRVKNLLEYPLTAHCLNAQ